MYQVESSESLEGVFRGGLINRGKNILKRFDSSKLRHGPQVIIQKSKGVV